MSLGEYLLCFKYTKKLVVEVLACLGSSADFLSVIFGIYGKFWIDIGVQKNFVGKFFVEKNSNFFRKIFGRKFLAEKIFDQKIFEKNQKFPKQYFSRKFFHLEKNFSKIFWTPMSIQNFPKIPKIILKKSCDEPKDAKMILEEKRDFLLY